MTSSQCGHMSSDQTDMAHFWGEVHYATPNSEQGGYSENADYGNGTLNLPSIDVW